MKRLLFLFAALTMTLSVSSQYKVEVEIGEKNMSKGAQLAFTTIIPESRSKDIEPIWKKYVNNRSVGERISNFTTQVGNLFKSKGKKAERDQLTVQKNGDELYVRSVESENISQHSLDIYARIIELTEGCQFSAFFQFTDSVFITETNIDAERMMSIETYIHDFGVEAYKSIVDNQIKLAKKEVSLQKRILKSIESKTRKKEKSITRYESDIQEYNASIFETESDILRLDETIDLKKIAFSAIMKDTPEYEVGKKELKDLGKEKSRYFRQIKSLKGNIKSKELDIKSAKNKISENEHNLVRQERVIQDKEQIVEQLISKKEGIQ